jgi:hypothetical protein
MSTMAVRTATNGRLVLAMFAALAVVALIEGQAAAALYLNEIYLDSPGGSDDDEYFEVHGTASDSLSNVWFIHLENERGAMSAVPGKVDFVYNLSSYSLSSGYAWFAPSIEDYNYGAGSNPAPTGNFTADTIENGGGTFLLINTGGVGTAPAVGHTWDTNDDGVFDTNWNSSWSVLDSIGVFATADDITGTNDGRLYADINFAAGVTTGISAQGITYATTGAGSISAALINTDRSDLDGSGSGMSERANGFAEIEYVARYGDTTGMGVANVDDWIAANLTDNAASGYTTSQNNYGISGDHSGLDDPEVVRGDDLIAPHAYGHDATTSLGAANSTTYTPEPGTAVLAMIAGLAATLRRRS